MGIWKLKSNLRIVLCKEKITIIHGLWSELENHTLRITMLDYLREVVDYDILFFIPNDEYEDAMTIRGERYLDPGENVSPTSVGLTWTVMLFKYDDDKVTDLEKFDAVLSEPREYISGLIPNGWFGVVAKDRKSTRLNSSHIPLSRMPSSA